MAEPKDYKVKREHLGDNLVASEGGGFDLVPTQFKVGDKRTADPAVVAGLLGSVLEDPDGEKSAETVQNKAATKPKNKAGG